MKPTIRLAAAVMAIAMLLAFAGCSHDKTPAKDEGEKDALGLTETERGRILELAQAFRLFGECDIEKGLERGSVEYMVWCMYTGTLGESEVPGYGSVSLKDSDAMLVSIFPGMSVTGMLRTKYDAAKEQSYYVLNDRYYVSLSDFSDISYEIISAEELKNEDGERIGLEAKVLVKKAGAEELAITLELADSEKSVYSVRKCGMDYYY